MQAQRAELAILLGKRVLRFRRIANMTQAALAAAIGVKPQTISKLESGVITMSAAQLWRLSRALNQPVTDFLDGLPGGSPKRDADPHAAAELRWDSKDRSGPRK